MVAEPEVNYFKSFDGVTIAYSQVDPEAPVSIDGPDRSLALPELAGVPVVLHHGFASDSRTNWIRSRVADALAEAGRSVVMIDARGHGLSEKPHDPAFYRDGAMVRDVGALVERLDTDRFDFVGYSMGAFVGVGVALESTIRRKLRRLVLGGAGSGQSSLRTRERAALIAEGLEAENPSAVRDATARAFRSFADATKADRLALAAIERSGAGAPDMSRLRGINVPTLVVNGDRDTLVGDPASYAEAIPGARLVVVPGDHLSAVMRPQFSRAVVDFLKEL